MGSVKRTDHTMKIFLTISALLAPASVGVGAGQTSHQSVSKPLQGENRGFSQSKALGASVASVSAHPSTLHGAHSNNAGFARTSGLSHGLVSTGVASSGLGSGIVRSGFGSGIVSTGLGSGIVGSGFGSGIVRTGLGSGIVGSR